MTDKNKSCRAVVIGAGIGGLCAAARLAHSGLKPLVLESTGQIGGRLGTIEIDGFKVSTGALAISVDDVLRDTFELVAAPFELAVPDPAVVIRVGALDLPAGGRVWKYLAANVSAAIAELTEGLRDDHQDPSTTVQAWVSKYTFNPTVHGLFQSMCVTMFTANADQVPIRELASILKRTGGFKTFGFLPHGGVEFTRGLAGAITRLGGEILTNAKVTAILGSADGVTGVRAVMAEGEEITVSSKAVFSDIGPANTAALVPADLDPEFSRRVEGIQPCTLFGLYFATTFPFMKYPGMLSLTRFERVSSVGCISATCPAWAPSGWNLYFANSVPLSDQVDSYSPEAELDLMIADLRTINPDLLMDDRSRIVKFTVHTGADNPGHRCLPGQKVSVSTPMPGLFEVGDGAAPVGWLGTSGSAEAARLAVKEMLDTIQRKQGQ